MLPVLLLLALTANYTVYATDKTPAGILVLGDSLSGAYGIDSNAGWVALLQQQINNAGYDYRVINASVSGDTTRTGLSRVDSALQTHQPAIVILALGGNDGLRGLPFAEIENSLAAIIERCQQHAAKVLLAGVRLPPNYGAEYNRGFTAIYERLAARYELPLLPRLLDGVDEQGELMQPDGIHPAVQAQAQIMQNVWRTLQPMLHRP